MTENNKLGRKYTNKRVNAKKEGIPFNLSLIEFKKLAAEAGITSEDMHIKGYHLARNNDCGAYEIGNCRFIYYLDNYKEKKVSEKVVAASKENIKKAFLELNGKNKWKYQRKAKRALKKWRATLTPEQKRKLAHGLSDEEIKRRHDVIKKIPNEFGRLTKASKILGITPQVIGRFLKNYPIK